LCSSLLTSQQELQQYHQQQIARTEQELAGIVLQQGQQPKRQQARELQQQRDTQEEQLEHHKRVLQAVSKLVSGLEAAATAASAGTPAADAAATPGSANCGGHQQQADQHGDSSSMWVFGGLAAPVSPGTAQQLRCREAIAAALRQAPEAVDIRYRWLQRLLCAYLQSACLPPINWATAGTAYCPLVRWMLDKGEGLQLVPKKQVAWVLQHIRGWARLTKADKPHLDQLKDQCTAAAPGGCGPRLWLRRPGAVGGPRLPYGWHKGGWSGKQLFWARRFDQLVMCAYGAMMTSAVGQVAEQWTRAIPAYEWVLPGDTDATLTQQQLALQQQIQQRVQELRQHAQQQAQAQVLAEQQEHHVAAAADAMDVDAPQEQQAGTPGVLQPQEPNGDATADVVMSDADVPDPAAAMQHHQQEAGPQQQLPGSYAAALHQHRSPQQLVGQKRGAPDGEQGAGAASSSQPPLAPKGHQINSDLQHPLKWEKVLQRLGAEEYSKDAVRCMLLLKFCNERLVFHQPAAGPAGAGGQPATATIAVLNSDHACQWGDGQPLMYLWAPKPRKQQQGKSGLCIMRLLPKSAPNQAPLNATYVTEDVKATLRAAGRRLSGWHDQIPHVPLSQALGFQLLVEIEPKAQPLAGEKPSGPPPDVEAVLLAAAAGLHVLYGQVVLPGELQVLLQLHPPTRIDQDDYTTPCKRSPAEVNDLADRMGGGNA
jgi:hypothetical protein